MANTTIYPYGTNGQLPSSIGVINDLTTGGADKALSAEMGRRLAMMIGTYAQAWVRSKVVPNPFCFLWVETISGNAIRKPIWHIGSGNFIDALGEVVNIDMPIAGTPVFSIATGSTVPRNTQVTITPATDNVLYYSTDGLNYEASATQVVLTLSTAGDVTIYAYCATNAGNGTVSNILLTVEGTPIPTFSEQNNSIVSRGGYVTITGDKDGTLHYKVGTAASYTDVVGDGINAPTASVQITGPTTIQAYNTVDGSDSSIETRNYTMAELAAPVFSKPTGSELAVGGEDITITAIGGIGIKYTTDGSDPASSGTAITASALTVTVNVSAAMTIKAVSYDLYGESNLSTAIYTIKEECIVIDTTESGSSVTVTLGYKNGNNETVSSGAITLDSTTLAPQGSGYRNTIKKSSLAGIGSDTITSITFSDLTKIKRIIADGLTLPAASSTYSGSTSLVYFEANIGNVNNSLYQTFYNTPTATFKLSGKAGSFNSTFRQSNTNNPQTIDLTGLDPYSSSGFSDCNLIASNQTNSTLKINGNFKISSSASHKNVVSTSTIRVAISTVEIHSDTPPDLTVDWVADMVAQAAARSTKISIKVPAGKIDTYKAAAGWSTYADHANVNWLELS